MTTAEALGVARPERTDRSLPAIAVRRLTGEHVVDEWGLDNDAVALAGHLPQARWGVRTADAGRIPDGPALLVHLGGGPLGWFGVVAGLGRATGRAIRFAGIPDRVPVGTVLRRLGGVVGDPADLRGLLRAGNLLAVSGDAVADDDASAVLPAFAAAAAVGAPAVPVVVRAARPWAPRPLVRVGPPVPTRARGVARDGAEVAAALRGHLERLRV